MGIHSNSIGEEPSRTQSSDTGISGAGRKSLPWTPPPPPQALIPVICPRGISSHTVGFRAGGSSQALDACAALGVPPGAAVMVGDSLASDIAGAANAKLLASVWVSPDAAAGARDAPAQPDFAVGSITSLPRILMQIEQDGGVRRGDGSSWVIG